MTVHVIVRDNTYMRNALRGPFAGAVRVATATLGDVAKGIHRSYRGVQSYLWGERRVTRDAARRMVIYLRERAGAFEKAAEDLEAAITREEEDV